MNLWTQPGAADAADETEVLNVTLVRCRLAQERQEAAEQRLHPSAAEDQKQKLLDSLSKAGVEDFTMKAAVPGSEVPGHKVGLSGASCVSPDLSGQTCCLVLDS